MTRELVLSTVLSVVWLSMCFMGFGALYALLGDVLGLQRMMEIEHALGRIKLPGTSISRVSLLFFSTAMVVGSLPINLYWLKRLRKDRDSR
ncbi:MAG: hypothetical protein KJO98_04680 [Rhodothermia bacterium]|nr:hypothetical protein [Rhodothermia bacterium]